jgi:uncharacterized repeat protein (TIGR01451 family)
LYTISQLQTEKKMTAHTLFTRALSIWGTRLFRVLFALVFAISLVGVNPVSAAPAGMGLQFNGSSQYVKFGVDNTLASSTYTIETWFKRTGAGVAVSTGSGGVDAIPLVTKGTSEEEAANIDINYFLGINSSTGVLIADFEEGAAGAHPSQNHPLSGISAITNNVWYHAAFTYDGTTMRLYLNGVEQSNQVVGQPAASATTSPTAFATSIRSNGTTIQGYFQGVMDEVRIWSSVRSQEEIQGDMFTELTSGTGLLGRWGMDEGNGTTIASSVGSFTGTLFGTPTWVDGFPLPDTLPPVAPTGFSGTPLDQGASLTWNANSESDLAGYDIYRGTIFGGPYAKINPSLLTSPSYSDSGLINGTPYYYVVRAVDTSARESGNSNQASVTPQIPSGYALQFDGSNDYVSFYQDPNTGPGVKAFTIETWFNYTGGLSTSTGTGGLAAAIPLVTKGRGEADSTNKDMNYFLGISGGMLAADFEECSLDAVTCPNSALNSANGLYGGLNYPVQGTLSISTGVWHHAAATLDGTNFCLYLDGQLDTCRVLTGGPRWPRWDSIQRAALGSALTSGGTAAGYLAGTLDEARIWSVAKTQAEIRADINNELASGTDLIARWGMDEGTGTTIASSVGTFPGTLTNGTTWVTPGAPFNLTFDSQPPVPPTGLVATSSNASAALDWDDNGESDLAGYNVYRGTTMGTYTKVNTSLVTASAYSDTGLINGTEYYYVVSAVDTSGNESTDSNMANIIPQAGSGSALQFTTDSGTYVTFGDPAKLDLATFTIETWFMRTGNGISITTGNSGIPAAIPLVAHGAQQSEGGTVDANWMLVIDDSTDVIAADFEDMVDGTNHPVLGATPISNDTWHHAAATYDGTTWKLYLDGRLERTLVVNAAPRSDTTQHAALGSMLNTSGGTNGFFNGVLDEARVWNRALTQTEILTNLNNQITSGSGLVARWGLNEGTGTNVGDSIATTANGTIMPETGANYAWVPGAPFDKNLTPDVPTLVSPVDNATGVSTSPVLTVHVADAQNSAQTVSFYGRVKGATGGADFTLIAIPDPQYYAASYPGIYNAQMNWVVTNKGLNNIKYVMSLGDNVDAYNTYPGQFTNATTAWDRLTTGSVPYGLGLGNHDGAPSPTTNFNTAFGSRIASQTTYGGRPDGATDYDNTYATFSASGMDFIVLFIEYDTSMTSTSNAVLVWANGILAANPTKRAIVVTHDLLDGNSNFTGQGSAIYEALKGNANLFLMLGGHLDGSKQRTDINNGHSVHSLRSDYQFVDSRQSGYLRILRFSPADNLIHVTTYSPNQSKFLTESPDQFDLAYPMDGIADFTLIGSTTVPSGTDASIAWPGRTINSAYEWYAVADNGGAAAVSPTWSFTTGVQANQAPVVTDIPDQTIAKGASFATINLDNYVSDSDNTDAEMTWTFSGNSQLIVNITARVATITPPSTDWTGAETITFRATDPGSLFDEDTATFTIIQPSIDLTCTTLQPKPTTVTTSDKPQSKVWNYNGTWYAVFPTTAAGASSAGTWLWKLQDTSWIEVLKLSTATDTKADVRSIGNLAHILLYNQPATQLVSVEFTAGTYQLWSQRPTATSINLPGSETATIDIDSTGRLWLATRQDSPAPAKIIVLYSDSPYSDFHGPIEIASGVVGGDDISVITAMPGNKIGILWSNQNTKRFGFRVHIDGADPTIWSTDELPASQSADDDTGAGMADDHLNVKVATDGTLYAAVKTGYDTEDFPKMALLVRRPNGTWDDLYGIDEGGTRGNIELDEGRGLLTFVYTQSEGNNPIVYRQSNLAPIAFDARKTLRAESFNDVSSTKQNYSSQLVIIYGNGSQVGGQICTGGSISGADLAITKTDGSLTVHPGDTLTYTIQVTNNGPQAVSAATVTDTFSSALQNITWTCAGVNGGTCTASGSGNINDSVNLPVSASVTYTVSATFDLVTVGTLTNTATVTAPAGTTDPNPGNNTATDTDTIIGIITACETDPTLVGCWQMEEGSGMVLVDGSSFGNDASVIGAPAWAAGKIGTYALDLNGSSDYALVPDDASLDLTTNVTVATWIKPEQYATKSIINKAVHGSVNGYELSLAMTKSDDSSQRAFFRINQVAQLDTCRINAATMYPIDGTWMHVAATFDGTIMKLYINGVLESSLTDPLCTLIATNNQPLGIGGQSDGLDNRQFMGWMDDVRVYNRALTLEQIQNLYNPTNQPPVITEGTSAPVSMSEDGSPNPFNLTLHATDPDVGNTLTWSVATPANHGAAGASGTGTSKPISYTPTVDYSGTDSFVVQVSDGSLTDTIIVNVTINAVNDPPVITNQATLTTLEDTALTIALGNLTVTDVDNTYPIGFSLTVLPGTNYSVVNPTITPALNYNGTLTVPVYVNDGSANSNTYNLTIAVTAVNDAPVANAQSVIAAVDTAKSITLTGSDPESDPLAYAIGIGPALGVLSGSPPNVTYTPSSGYTGPDSFTFTVSDVEFTSSPATVSITVTGAEIYSLALLKGWNLVSFPLHPTSTTITDVLSSVAGYYDLVYAWDASGAHSGAGNWMRYAPGIPGNTLSTLDETQGFWIRMTDADTLDIVGTAPTTTTNISLLTAASGWNLVGYPSIVNRSMPDALTLHGVTAYNLVYAYHANETDTWKRYAPGVPGNDLLELAPAWAYWIKVSAISTWEVRYLADLP